MTDQEIQSYLNQHNFDLRTGEGSRWIDQKLTPDILWSVSDYICAYIEQDDNITFTPRDIWNSEYAKNTVKLTYSKPALDDIRASSEYDKVFAQPMNLLCYAGIIEDIGQNSRHLYKVKNKKILSHIARNDMFSYKFLVQYITKVLKDSGLYEDFQLFFDKQTKQSYYHLKDTFVDFYHTYTKIKKKYEPNRIFTKVINPLSCYLMKKGSERGRISKKIITVSDLMYNRNNFKDAFFGKPKNVTRQEWMSSHPEVEYNAGYYQQVLNSVGRIIREYNRNYLNGESELSKYSSAYPDNALATQAHHIFSKTDFPSIKHYIENLIMLTPNQHNLYAHPNNRTSVIDTAAQKEILIAKTYSIKANLEDVNADHIYEFNSFLTVLSVGFSDDRALEIVDNNYQDVLSFINQQY